MTPRLKAPTAEASASRHGEFAGVPVARGAPATDFALRDQDGQVVRLSRERGKIVLLTFLYVHCPDICPLIAENLNQVLRALGPARDSVRVIAVSVDPTGDTPRAVRTFIEQHRLLSQFRYLHGTRAQLQPVWQDYNILVEPRNLERVDHSAYVLLIDAVGKPRVVYATKVGWQDVLHDLRLFLPRRSH